jgi:hypothetical protein
MEKKLILVYLGIFMMTFVISAPPVTTVQDFPEGFVIEHPNFDYLELNKDYEVNIHVFNSTNGYFIDNSTVNCSIHLYNKSGFHLIQDQMDFIEPYDFEYNIKGGNFSEENIYSIIFFCFNGESGGFIQKTLQITKNGFPIDDSRTNTNIFLISLFAGFGFFMFMSAAKLPQDNIRNDDGRLLHVSHLKYLRFPFWGIGYFAFIAVMFLSGSLATTYLGTSLGQMFYFISYLMMFAIIPMMYVFLMKIIEDVWYDKELRRNIKMGFEEDGFK